MLWEQLSFKSWSEFAFFIGDIETIIAFFICMFIWIRTGVNAISISLTSWVLGNFFMERIAPFYKNIKETLENPEFIQQAWYLTWIIFYCLMLYFIWKMINKYKLPITWHCKSIVFTISCLSTIQALRYLDRFVLETDFLLFIYQWSGFYLNLVPVVISLFYIKSNDYKAKLQEV